MSSQNQRISLNLGQLNNTVWHQVSRFVCVQAEPANLRKSVGLEFDDDHELALPESNGAPNQEKPSNFIEFAR